MNEWPQWAQAIFWILLSALMLYNPIRVYAKWVGHRFGVEFNGTAQRQLLILAYLTWYVPVAIGFLGMLFDEFRYVLFTWSFALLWVIISHSCVIYWSKKQCGNTIK